MWNERFAANTSAYGEEPNAFLVETAGRIAMGSEILVMGDGQGRNALYLARKGHRVTVVDYSEVAMDQLRRRAEEQGVELEILCEDLVTYEPRVFDAIV